MILWSFIEDILHSANVFPEYFTQSNNDLFGARLQSTASL